MESKDTLISRELRVWDCLYGVNRQYKWGTRIVYVLVESLTIIPNIKSAHVQDVLNVFSVLPEWRSDSWTTLTVYQDGEGFKAKTDAFKPHRLDERMLQGNYRVYNYVELPVIETYQRRVARVMLKGRSCFLKIARCPKDIDSVAHELGVYHTLMERRSTAAPKLLGYACEGAPSRVVGFFYEEVVGTYPVLSDMSPCEHALAQLHEMGVFHGDVNRYNILVTHDGRRAKFIDFECSTVAPKGWKGVEWQERKAEDSLNLLDELMNGYDSWEGPHVVENHRYLEGLRISLD